MSGIQLELNSNSLNAKGLGQLGCPYLLNILVKRQYLLYHVG